jgi:hypothetical protein
MGPGVRKTIVVRDLMQQGYRYELTETAGRDFDPRFRPELTPREMLELGVFGGKYMTDCAKEFPKSWFARAKLSHERHDPKLNFFGVNASQPLKVWRDKGWISKEDPRGWFQWYCRTTGAGGGRSQIRRCRPEISARLQELETAASVCRPRQRQALLHWAYDT